MHPITFGRLVSVILALVTFGYLFVHDSFRSDNLFLLPDLVICALLLMAAAAPRRWAPAAMIIALAMAAGVFLTSVSAYLVAGEWGVPSMIGAVAAVATAGLLGRRATR